MRTYSHLQTRTCMPRCQYQITMFKEGKSIQFGVLQSDVNPSTIPSDKERKERVAKATKDLVNIDDLERGRRKTIGLVGSALSSAVYAGMYV